MIGHPIVGDRKYDQEGMIRKNKGLFLCAVGLTFQHPISDDTIALQIPLPNKFKALLRQEDRRWHKFHQ
jgi:23S rRNA-/tRNA-specific pseudouridylate synthase